MFYIKRWKKNNSKRQTDVGRRRQQHTKLISVKMHWHCNATNNTGTSEEEEEGEKGEESEKSKKKNAQPKYYIAKNRNMKKYEKVADISAMSCTAIVHRRLTFKCLSIILKSIRGHWRKKLVFLRSVCSFYVKWCRWFPQQLLIVHAWRTDTHTHTLQMIHNLIIANNFPASFCFDV